MVYNHILVLHASDGNFHKTKYVTDVILALRDSGYKVYLITTTPCIKYITDVPIKTICSWLPTNILGYLRNEICLLKSLILAFYASAFPPKGEATYVICDGSTLSIPILKYFNFHVTFLNYMVSFQNSMTKITDVKIKPISLHLLRKANDVIVPTRQCKLMLMRSRCQNVNILSPCCTKSSVVTPPSTPESRIVLNNIGEYMFTVFGEFRDYSNFIMVIEALRELKVMLQPHIFENIKLIFTGKCDTDLEKREWINIDGQIAFEDPSIQSKIQLYNVSEHKAIRTYLKHSLALIDVTENTLFNTMILRAQELSVPVICFNSGYCNEIIKHEETGIFISKHPIAMRNCMHRCITKPDWLNQMKVNVKNKFRDRFSTKVYVQNVKDVIIRGYVKKLNLNTTSSSMTLDTVTWNMSTFNFESS